MGTRRIDKEKPESKPEKSEPRVVAPKRVRSRARLEWDAIARLAYERFVERGFVHGHDVEDWLWAERELGA